MNAQVISLNTQEVNLSIKEADIGILYIIQHELLKDSGTAFAGIIVKHPLTNECWIRVNSKSKPIQQIKKATESAMSVAEDFKQLFNSAIKED